MTSLATNAKNDIYMDGDNNLAVVRGLAAVIQDCQAAVECQLGEVPLAKQIGVPTLESIWLEWKPAQFEAYARRMVLLVPNVNAVRSFSITKSGGVAAYTMEIESDFGPATVNGTLTQ